jgi:hypothetical protein
MANFKFRYFWPNFDVDDNFILTLLQPVMHVNSLNQDITLEIHSVFTRPRRFYEIYIRSQIAVRKVWYKCIRKKAIFIWYSGENIAPPPRYDLTLSFKPTTDTNIYWPFWVTRVIEQSKKNHQKTQSDDFFSKYTLPRENGDVYQRNWKICTFLSNPTAWRLELAKELEDLGLLDIYGSSVDRYVVSKPDKAKEYVFELCFENELSEGYVTEKVIESWDNGCIPIYSGMDTQKYLNTEAILDLTGLEFSEVVSKISSFLRDINRINQVTKEPILRRTFDTNLFGERVLSSINRKYP